MKVQIVTPFRVSHLQRYGVTVRGNAYHNAPTGLPSWVKGRVIPLQALTGPEGFRRLSFPDVEISEHEGGKVVSPTHRPPLSPRIISVRG
jgi:hypothetical protein